MVKEADTDTSRQRRIAIRHNNSSQSGGEGIQGDLKNGGLESDTLYPDFDPDLVNAASVLAAVAVSAESENSQEFPSQQRPSSLRASSIRSHRRSDASLSSLGGPRALIRKRRSAMMENYFNNRISRGSFKTDGDGVSGEDVDMEQEQGPDDFSAPRGLLQSNLESPSSPLAGYKGVRGSNMSDDGTASIIDMDEVAYLDPDSVPAMIGEIRKMLAYVASKPSLQNGSASFMRDYLRTLLTKSSIAASESIQVNKKANKMLQESGMEGIVGPPKFFKTLPDELSKHVFSFLDGRNLAAVRMVCRKWNEFACEDYLWKDLCVKKWRSLETDEALWRLVFGDVCRESPTKWRQIYPKVLNKTRWKCRLMKTGRFICNLSAHQLSGTPLGKDGLPPVLVVERRFNMLHLRTFVLPEASVLYFEPLEDKDKNGFNDFIDYLIKRTRAGLALEEQRRFIFIPPCEYTRSYVRYDGPSLIGVVQTTYPPLAPV